MPAYRPEATDLIERRKIAVNELASLTMRWNLNRQRGADPAEIRSLNAQIAALNESLTRMDQQLTEFEI